MMLSPELDKLRDKTLRFGCIVRIYSWYLWGVPTTTEAMKEFSWYRVISRNGNYHENNDRVAQPKIDRIVWHPLTRWRLSYLRSKLGEIDERFKIAEIPMIFEEHIELYDQDELQRMQHPKRPEFFEILKEFAALLPSDEVHE